MRFLRSLSILTLLFSVPYAANSVMASDIYYFSGLAIDLRTSGACTKSNYSATGINIPVIQCSNGQQFEAVSTIDASPLDGQERTKLIPSMSMMVVPDSTGWLCFTFGGNLVGTSSTAGIGDFWILDDDYPDGLGTKSSIAVNIATSGALTNIQNTTNTDLITSSSSLPCTSGSVNCNSGAIRQVIKMQSCSSLCTGSGTPFSCCTGASAGCTPSVTGAKIISLYMGVKP